MTNLKENGATTVQVEEKNNQDELKDINTINQNQEIQNYEDGDENLFYPPCTDITEDVAIQKLMLLSNSMLKLVKILKNDFEILIGYQNLAKLQYNPDSSDKILNGFYDMGDFSFADLYYCLEEGNSFFEPRLYGCSDLDEDSADYDNFLYLISEVVRTDPKSFFETSRNRINIISLMVIDESFKNVLIFKKLIGLSFKFDVQYTKRKKVKANSTITAKFSFLDDANKEEAKLLTHTWIYSLKSVLANSPSRVRHEVISESIKELMDYQV